MTEPAGRSTPVPSLRERKKMAAMQRIQKVALAMIDERGFDRVTVEEVAAAAEVSPSTVYRYFGTKEGMVLTDAFDEQSFAAMDYLLRKGVPPWDAVLTAVREVSSENADDLDELGAVRARMWFEVPQVKAAGLGLIDAATQTLTEAIVAGGRYERPQAQVIGTSILWALVAGLRNWYEAGATGDWQDFIEDAAETMRRLEPPSERPVPAGDQPA